jgi:hypothetical protein
MVVEHTHHSLGGESAILYYSAKDKKVYAITADGKKALAKALTVKPAKDKFKSEFLFEEDAADLHELVKDPFKWKKWDYTPNGDRILVGSTTDLTVKGFSQYLEQVHAFGSSLGVMFHVRGQP